MEAKRCGNCKQEVVHDTDHLRWDCQHYEPVCYWYPATGRHMHGRGTKIQAAETVPELR